MISRTAMNAARRAVPVTTAAGRTSLAPFSSSASKTEAKSKSKSKSKAKAKAKAKVQSKKSSEREVVIVEGVRTAFKTSGSEYTDLMAYDLGRVVLKEVADRASFLENGKADVDYVLFGTVIQEVRTSNIARDALLGAGYPSTVPAHTITQACISSNQAISTAAEKILSGRADVVVAAGAETFSDVPIRFQRSMRKRLLKADKVKKKGAGAILGAFKGMSLTDLAPEAPAIKNFITGEIMGHSSDRLAAKFGVSRQEMDEYAMMSHHKAAAAAKDGRQAAEVMMFKGNRIDNGVRGDSTLNDYEKMRAAFVRPHGTHTAANSSFLTDGAAATMLMSAEKAESLEGCSPKAYLRDWTCQAVDPFDELLLGPAYCIAQILHSNNLQMSDIDVWEIHEAFAGQVLANLAALRSTKFCQEKLGRDTAVGEVDHSKLNLLGGSLSIGHPFGATGCRLTNTAANRLQAEDGRFAVVAACADSGLGVATLLERY